MPLRQFNYLDRKRILREHVHIVVERNGDTRRFKIKVDLEHYGFAPEARIVVEARNVEIVRRECGNVRSPKFSGHYDMSAIKNDNARFDVLIIDVATSRKLGEATGVPAENELAGLAPLLPVDGSRDLQGPAWMLEYSGSFSDQTSDAPVLLIDRTACDGSASTFLAHPLAAANILPAVMSQVLSHILFRDEYVYDPSGEDWRSGWIRMAAGLVTPPDDISQEDPSVANTGEVAEWIDQVVKVFARDHGFVAKVVQGVE